MPSSWRKRNLKKKFEKNENLAQGSNLEDQVSWYSKSSGSRYHGHKGDRMDSKELHCANLQLQHVPEIHTRHSKSRGITKIIKLLKLDCACYSAVPFTVINFFNTLVKFWNIGHYSTAVLRSWVPVLTTDDVFTVLALVFEPLTCCVIFVHSILRSVSVSVTTGNWSGFSLLLRS